MSLRRIILILVALVVSAGTVLVGRAWLHAERNVAAAQPAPPPKLSPMVLVAKGNLPTGQFIRPDSLRWQAWPEDGVAPNYVLQSQHKLEDYIGAVVRSGMNDGEPVTDARIVRPGDRGFMAAVLAPGDRAVSVPVTVASGVSGFIFPGDRVDVLLTFTVQAGKDVKDKVDHRATETVLTDVRVLGVDQRADDQNKEVVVAKTATLEVTPKQAEVVAVAEDLGKLSLSLRSLAHDDSDENHKPRVSYTWDSDAARLLPAPKTSGSTVTVSVVRGKDMTEVDVPRSSK